jgi:hypothetical protein
VVLLRGIILTKSGKHLVPSLALGQTWVIVLLKLGIAQGEV